MANVFSLVFVCVSDISSKLPSLFRFFTANNSHAAVNALTNAITLNIPGAIGSVADAGIDNSAIYSNAQVTVNQTTAQADAEQDHNENLRDYAIIGLTNKLDAQIDNIENVRDNNDALTSGTASAAANLTTANAGRALNTAQNAVSNQVMQSGLSAPFEYSRFANGEYAATRPMGLFCNIVTQDECSIKYAGDLMLRYGYAYNRYWEFDGDWNVCNKFTYWKLSDFWVTNLHIPDMYVDRIRFFLFGGVTVWRKPEDIGTTDIYSNIDWS